MPCRFDPATNRKYLDLCKVLNAEEGADMDEDEDVMLEDGQNIELNTTCPMTMKSVRLMSPSSAAISWLIGTRGPSLA